MSWGLVLGGGGVLGAAWMVGALAALERVHRLDPRDADVIVGTSAGSVMAALLGAGVSVTELRSHQLGDPVVSGPLAAMEWDYDTATGGANPPLPRPGLGSANLLTTNARRLRRLPPTAVLAALLPEGRGSLETVGRLVSTVNPASVNPDGVIPDGVHPDGVHPGGWSRHPGLRIVAMDFDAGRRVAFGDSQAPQATLPDAVMASCAIPGWYSPVVIDGVRYVDGGACSGTNVDLLAGLGLDEVYVLAPMVSFWLDMPDHWRARMERRWRQRVARRCIREVAKVHAGGTEVTVLGPGPRDLEAIGSNLMDVQRRRHVLETSLQTSIAALEDPEPLPHLPGHDLEDDDDQAPSDVVPSDDVRDAG